MLVNFTVTKIPGSFLHERGHSVPHTDSHQLHRLSCRVQLPAGLLLRLAMLLFGYAGEAKFLTPWLGPLPRLDGLGPTAKAMTTPALDLYLAMLGTSPATRFQWVSSGTPITSVPKISSSPSSSARLQILDYNFLVFFADRFYLYFVAAYICLLSAILPTPSTTRIYGAVAYYGVKAFSTGAGAASLTAATVVVDTVLTVVISGSTGTSSICGAIAHTGVKARHRDGQPRYRKDWDFILAKILGGSFSFLGYCFARHRMQHQRGHSVPHADSHQLHRVSRMVHLLAGLLLRLALLLFGYAGVNEESVPPSLIEPGASTPLVPGSCVPAPAGSCVPAPAGVNEESVPPSLIEPGASTPLVPEAASQPRREAASQPRQESKKSRFRPRSSSPVRPLLTLRAAAVPLTSVR